MCTKVRDESDVYQELKKRWLQQYNVFSLIKAGSHIQAGGLTAFVPVQAGCLIEAGV